jgi:hypothetical protein
MKRCSLPLANGKYKPKPQWGTTSHPLGCLWFFFKGKITKDLQGCGKIGALVSC